MLDVIENTIIEQLNTSKLLKGFLKEEANKH